MRGQLAALSCTQLRVEVTVVQAADTSELLVTTRAAQEAEDEFLCAKMHLVDLAGSERLKRTGKDPCLDKKFQQAPKLDGTINISSDCHVVLDLDTLLESNYQFHLTCK